MVPAMRPRTFVIAMGILAGCSSGSGVTSSKALASLSADEYKSVCGFYNGRTQALVGQTCSVTQQKVLRVFAIDCSTNPFAANPTCAATVSDVEACASKTDACSALSPQRPAECVKVAQCVGGGS